MKRRLALMAAPCCALEARKIVPDFVDCEHATYRKRVPLAYTTKAQATRLQRLKHQSDRVRADQSLQEHC